MPANSEKSPVSAWLLPLFLLAAAPFIGSFVGLLVMRLPEDRPVVFARSACDRCTVPLVARDLIPIVSWVFQRARCRHCGERLSIFYPSVELAALAVVVWAAAIVSGWILPVTVLFGWTLLALALIDWRTQTLPDVLTLPLAVTGLAVAHAIDPAALVDHVIGAGAGFLVFAGISVIYRIIRGRDGLGLGDAKLLGALGAWVSWTGIPTIVLYAGAIGLAVALANSFTARSVSASDRLPLGTFLAIGGWLVWLYGPLGLS